jgi:hypothetical protein
MGVEIHNCTTQQLSALYGWSENDDADVYELKLSMGGVDEFNKFGVIENNPKYVEMLKHFNVTFHADASSNEDDGQLEL